MSKNFMNTVKMPTVNSNTFDLTHDVKMSIDMGILYPCMVMDCVPGDRIKIAVETLIRFSPLLAPVMHRFNVSIHYFFVPNRLIWPAWEEFITGNSLEGPDGPQPLPAFPYVLADSINCPIKSLGNYLGLPVMPASPNPPVQISALPFMAYFKIWADYYRDQNLITEPSTALNNGNNTVSNGQIFNLQHRAWEHDYFTSALPYAQKGAGVSLPLGTFNDVEVYTNVNDPAGATWPNLATGGNVGTVYQDFDGTPSGVSNFFADTSTLIGTAATINDLRTAFRLQEWLEKNARGGTRYIESMLVHFGVKSSDARLNRPEYITGSISPVVVSEILNTTGDTLPQGNMAGHALSVTSGKQGSYYCEEHGYIIGVLSVLPKTAYQQGVHKHFMKFDPLDFYWPSFANLGEQEIINREIFVNHSDPDGVFGYIPRYAEYRTIPSRVAGDFMTSLNYWHASRIFASEPSLNAEFIECSPDDRIFAVTAFGTDNLYCHVLNKVYANRKMPKFGTPSF